MKKKLLKLFSVLIAVLIVFGMGNLSSIAVAQAPDPNLDKVEARVLETISKDGTSDFVVEMAQKADLSQAYSISDWNERGWFVYDTLKEVAARTQKPVIEILEKQGVKYQSFFAGNEVAVTASDLGILSESPLSIRSLISVTRAQQPLTPAFSQSKKRLSPRERSMPSIGASRIPRLTNSGLLLGSRVMVWLLPTLIPVSNGIIPRWTKPSNAALILPILPVGLTPPTFAVVQPAITTVMAPTPWAPSSAMTTRP